MTKRTSLSYCLDPSVHSFSTYEEKDTIVYKNCVTSSIVLKFSIEVFFIRYLHHSSRGDERSIKVFNCSQNFTFARFARKI